MGRLKVIGKPIIGRVVPQRSFESLGGCAPLGDKPTDRHAVASDDDCLAALDLVEDVREVASRLGGRYRNHVYILSDLI